MKPKHSFKTNPIDWCEEHQTSLHECAARHGVFGYTNPRERELEAENERLKAEGQVLVASNTRFHAEIERLKAANRELANRVAIATSQAATREGLLQQAEAKLERVVKDCEAQRELPPR